MKNRIQLLGINIDPLTMNETISVVEQFVSDKRPLHLMGVNADKINQCHSDDEIKRIVNESEVINADGASVVIAARYLGYSVPERVAGIDLMQELLVLANKNGYSVYFFGAKEEVLTDMLAIFKKDYPNLQVVGHRNGYFSAEEEEIIQEDIRKKNPDFVFVGITSPKKEYLIQKFEVLKKIQEIELDALKEFNKICKENNLMFFLRGGSVMGAVKYQGFIPWDDDVDIAVPREDYDQLPQIFENKIIAGKYQVLCHQYCEELHCYFPRLFLLEDERIKLGLPRNTNLGLHLIDIIPLDGAPNNSLVRKVYYLKVYWYRFLASLGTTYKGDHIDMHSKKQKLLIGLFKKLGFAKLFPQNSVYNRLDRLYKRYDWKKQHYAGTVNASLFTKEVMPSYIWGKGVFLRFEDTEYRVPSDYDNYLKRLYGENYFYEEPAEEDRKSHIGG